jgi:hypothetical protein
VEAAAPQDAVVAVAALASPQPAPGVVAAAVPDVAAAVTVSLRPAPDGAEEAAAVVSMA